MPATYEPIATTTLGAAAANITFSSIPATYTDLRLVLVTKPTPNNASITIRVNNLTNNIYSYTNLTGNGTTASSGSSTSTNLFNWGTAFNTAQFQLLTVDFFSYAGSTNKTALATLSRDLNGSGSITSWVGMVATTSAITEIDIDCSTSNNMVIGTTATLYGILKA